MSLYNNVPGRIEYIQNLFLRVGNNTSIISNVQELLKQLDEEPPEFRSIAYEGASFEIGRRNLEKDQHLEQWISFREAGGTRHTFHIDIGLGWAFAKAELIPDPLLSPMQKAVKWMVFDGIGYYYALFKGRTTLKAKIVPKEINGESLNGFDQGVGRRLWYMAKGRVEDVKNLVESFPEERHLDLFRGIGIACGYVGGSTEGELKQLLEICGAYQKQLQTGVMLAAISRIASKSVNEDIKRACYVVCNKGIDEIGHITANTSSNFSIFIKQAQGKIGSHN